MTFWGYTFHCLNTFRTQGSREQLFLGIPCPALSLQSPAWPGGRQRNTGHFSLSFCCEELYIHLIPWLDTVRTKPLPLGTAVYLASVSFRMNHMPETRGVSQTRGEVTKCCQKDVPVPLASVPERAICLNSAVWNCCQVPEEMTPLHTFALLRPLPHTWAALPEHPAKTWVPGSLLL